MEQLEAIVVYRKHEMSVWSHTHATAREPSRRVPHTYSLIGLASPHIGLNRDVETLYFLYCNSFPHTLTLSHSHTHTLQWWRSAGLNGQQKPVCCCFLLEKVNIKAALHEHNADELCTQYKQFMWRVHEAMDTLIYNSCMVVITHWIIDISAMRLFIIQLQCKLIRYHLICVCTQLVESGCITWHRNCPLSNSPWTSSSILQACRLCGSKTKSGRPKWAAWNNVTCSINLAVALQGHSSYSLLTVILSMLCHLLRFIYSKTWLFHWTYAGLFIVCMIKWSCFHFLTATPSKETAELKLGRRFTKCLWWGESCRMRDLRCASS